MGRVLTDFNVIAIANLIAATTFARMMREGKGTLSFLQKGRTRQAPARSGKWLE